MSWCNVSMLIIRKKSKWFSGYVYFYVSCHTQSIGFFFCPLLIMCKKKECRNLGYKLVLKQNLCSKTFHGFEALLCLHTNA